MNQYRLHALGITGEHLARMFYESRGYAYIASNVRIARVGEIDLIMAGESSGSPLYVFVEVKTRSNSKTGFGYEAVTYAKRIRMCKCAMTWIGANSDRSYGHISWRLDVLSIDMERGQPVFSHFENIEVS